MGLDAPDVEKRKVEAARAGIRATITTFKERRFKRKPSRRGDEKKVLPEGVIMPPEAETAKAVVAPVLKVIKKEIPWEPPKKAPAPPAPPARGEKATPAYVAHLKKYKPKSIPEMEAEKAKKALELAKAPPPPERGEKATPEYVAFLSKAPPPQLEVAKEFKVLPDWKPVEYLADGRTSVYVDPQGVRWYAPGTPMWETGYQNSLEFRGYRTVVRDPDTGRERAIHVGGGAVGVKPKTKAPWVATINARGEPVLIPKGSARKLFRLEGREKTRLLEQLGLMPTWKQEEAFRQMAPFKIEENKYNLAGAIEAGVDEKYLNDVFGREAIKQFRTQYRAHQKDLEEYSTLLGEYDAWEGTIDNLKRGGYAVVRRGGQLEVDTAKYLRDNPGDLTTLAAAGFSSADIKEAQEFNRKYLGIGTPDYVPADKFARDYFKTRGWKWQVSPTALPGKQKLFANRLQKASIAHQAKFDPPMAIETFIANYFSEKGWKEVPKVGLEPAEVAGVPAQFATSINPKIKEYEQRRDGAIEAYAKIYGARAVVESNIGKVMGFVFLPARAIRPEVKLKDISALEWTVGVAQVALLAAPLVAAPFGRIATAGAARIVSGVQMGAIGTLTGVTVAELPRLSSTQAALYLGLDVLIMAAVLRGAGVRLPKIPNPSQLATDVRKCFVRLNEIEGLKHLDPVLKGRIDKALFDISKGIQLKNDAMVKRGVEAFMKATEGKVPASVQRVIKDGGHYIKKVNFAELVDRTRALGASSVAKQLQADRVSAEALGKTLNLWQRETTAQLQARLLESIKKAKDFLRPKMPGPKYPKEIDLALKEVEALTTKAGRAKTWEMALNRLEEAQRRLTNLRKALLKEPTESDKLFDSIIRHLKETRRPLYRETFTTEQMKDRISALTRRLGRLKQRNELGVGKLVSNIDDYLDDIDKYLKDFKAKGLTTGQQKNLDQFLKYLYEQKRKLASINASKLVEAQKAKAAMNTIADVEKYVADIRKTGLNEWQKRLMDKIAAQVRRLRRQKAEAKWTIEDLEAHLAKARKARTSADVEKAIKEAEDIIKGKRGGVPKEELDDVLDDLDDFLKDAKDVRPSGGMGKPTRVAVKEKPITKVKTKVEVKPEVKPVAKTFLDILPEREVKPMVAPTPGEVTEATPLTIAISKQLITTKTTPAKAPIVTTYPYTSPWIIEAPEPEPFKSPFAVPAKAPFAVKEPAPVLALQPAPAPAPLPKPQPKPKAGEKPAPVPEPKPEPKPEPAPEPEPAPVPEPKPKPKPAPLPPDASDEEKRELIQQTRGAVTWNMGKLGKENPQDVWHVRLPDGKHLVVIGKAPKGAEILADGPGSAYKTAQVTGERRSAFPKFRQKHGAVTATLQPAKIAKGARISFAPSPGLQSKKKGRMYQTKMGKTTAYSRHRLGGRR